MKLLLVIDVADDIAEAYEDFTVDYDFRGTPKDDQKVNESIKYVEDCPLRPLSKELHNYTAILHPTDNNDWLNNMYSEYENGWNDCLEAITGEKE